MPNRLDVDTSSTPNKKLQVQLPARPPVASAAEDRTRAAQVNVDIYLPSLPCGELVTDVVDESGLQQLAVTDTLQKLRVDRHGTPCGSLRPAATSVHDAGGSCHE